MGRPVRSLAAASAVLFVVSCGNGSDPPPPATTSAAVTVASATASATATHSETASSTSSATPTSAASSAPTAADVVPEGMISIPAGLFKMGVPAAYGNPEERPQHEVAVAALFLDKTEVTVAAYRKCVEAGVCKPPHDTTFCNFKHTDREDHPINCVDHHHAEAYCAWANKRLPSEEEWEYAGRGGAEQRMFSWGEEDPSPKNACYQHGESCQVGSFPPGAFGLLDMSGNVWEWTSSWFGTYPSVAETGTHRVYRGGSWSRRFPKWLRNSVRNRYLPDEFSASVGFRCARDRAPVTCPPDHDIANPNRKPENAPICKRVSGAAWCEAGHAWDEKAKQCSGYDSQKKPEKTPEELAAEPVVKTRTPQHDGDCASHYKGLPAAYRFSGNTFHARNPMIAAGGCTRRDMGQTWTSACCPQ